MITLRGARARTLLLRAGLTGVLLLIARLTEFSNEMILEISPSTVRLRSHANTAEVALPVSQITGVSVTLQSSMSGGVRLISYAATTSNGLSDTLRFDCVYLFGRCLFGSALYERAPGFTLSFGDWTMDRFVSAPLTGRIVRIKALI